MQANILKYFKIQANIYKLLQLPKNKPSASTELYITTRKIAFDTEVLKTLEIHQYIDFFVIEGLLEVFTVYLRPAMRDYQRGGNKS